MVKIGFTELKARAIRCGNAESPSKAVEGGFVGEGHAKRVEQQRIGLQVGGVGLGVAVVVVAGL